MSSRRHPLVIYGASGFSGRLIVAEAVRRGLSPLLAGRRLERLEPVARGFDLPCAAAALDDPVAVRALAESGVVLLNAAGPFVDTAPALMDACVDSGTHYLDITGEVSVVEGAVRRSARAAARDVMLMPAAGFDVVPSDCLALHVARLLPGATTLRIGIEASTTLSRGSFQTALTQATEGVMVRRDGRLVATPPGSQSHHFDFGNGPRLSLGVGLADVTTAYHSTGIPNVATYMRASAPLWATLTAMRISGRLMSTPAWRSLVRGQAGMLGEGPDEEARQAGWATIVAEAVDDHGRRRAARLRTAEPYTVTAACAVLAAERAISGEVPSGFRTPAEVLGADFILGVEGSTREDL